MALAAKGGIEIDGLERFQRLVSRAADRQLPKEMGKAHKELGEFIISKLQPRPVDRAVGAGRGSSVRPSASRYSVQLRAGGSHRADQEGADAPKEIWGTRYTGRPPRGRRPHIIGTAKQHEDEIMDRYWEAIKDAFGPAFWEAWP